MRRRIELYINNQVADLDEESLVLFNYTKDNIDNPSVVRNSFSRQVTLKGTSRNNRIFEGMYRADRTSPSGALSVMEQIPFRIVADKGIVIESGYCKIDSVQRDGAKVTYTITLYGGLGSIFYKLSTDDDGDALTLADLTYGGVSQFDKGDTIGLSANALNLLWNHLSSYLASGDLTMLGANFNFNPCYNGVPDNFDNTKVMVHQNDYVNLPSVITKDGVAYQPKTGANGKYILQMGGAYDMQDTNDCRAYLMRPMLNVRAVLGAIDDFLDDRYIEFDYDDIKNLPYIKSAWMTLANISAEKRSLATITIGELLEGTCSPASFLISLARIFGFSFITFQSEIAQSGMGLRIVTRNGFFNDSAPIDINGRIDRSKAMTLSPVYADNRWFDFALEGVGETAKKHKDTYGREYGSQRVDTSYPFSEGVKDVWESAVFKTSAEIAETGIDTTRAVVAYSHLSGDSFFLPVVNSNGGITAEMYDAEGQKGEVSLPTYTTGYSVRVVPETAGWFVRNQLCEADRKQADDIGVIMFIDNTFNTTQAGTITITDPVTQEEVTVNIAQRKFLLHSYDAKMVELTGGEECWDMTTTAIVRTTIPLWRNAIGTSGDFNNDFNDDFTIGNTGGEISILPTGIYAKMWQKYIGDRYDKDARIMKCYVDFSGMQVGDALLRRLFYFDNTIWVLNKITNYSLTTYDAVECEFVRVMDMNNYTNGQI